MKSLLIRENLGIVYGYEVCGNDRKSLSSGVTCRLSWCSTLYLSERIVSAIFACRSCC